MAIALRLTAPLKAADGKLPLQWPSLASAAPARIFDFCQSFIPGCLWPGARREVVSPTKEAMHRVNNAWKTRSVSVCDCVCVCEFECVIVCVCVGAYVCVCVCSKDYTLHHSAALYIWDLGPTTKGLTWWRRANRIYLPVSVYFRAVVWVCWFASRLFVCKFWHRL